MVYAIDGESSIAPAPASGVMPRHDVDANCRLDHTKGEAKMPHRGSERYFETIWASLSEGLRKRIIAAVKKSIGGRSPDGAAPEAIVTALSDEHRHEVDWIAVAEEDSDGNAPFIVKHSSNTRPGIKLSEGMVSYVEHHVLDS